MSRMLVCAVCALVLGCSSERQRPSCSSGAPDCGEGWRCSESRLCDLPFCPTGHTCMALGILAPGERCLADSECVDGVHCSRRDPTDWRCRADECAQDADCGGPPIVCRAAECVPSLGASCSRDRGHDGCSEHESCRDFVCVAASPDGGDPCPFDDSYCADGRACIEDPLTSSVRCTTCFSDADCEGDAAWCNGGHCALCSDDSCGAATCRPAFGCAECETSAECATGWTCVEGGCRQPCSDGAHETCDSGQCDFSDYCYAAVGTRCPRRTRDDAVACFEGPCLDRDADGVELDEPYCTRWCLDGVYAPCPSGYACQPFSVDGLNAELCVRAP